jgi:acetyltransferase
VGTARLKDGSEVRIRPIRAEDEPSVAELHKKLSERSVRLRYFQDLQLGQRTAHERLVRVCFGDYDREIALVVERLPAGAVPEFLAVARLSKNPGHNDAEFALVISDEWQHRGLGTELLRRLVQIGKDEGLAAITADILPDNLDMQRVCEKVGFQLEHAPGEPVVRAVLPLGG